MSALGVGPLIWPYLDPYLVHLEVPCLTHPGMPWDPLDGHSPQSRVSGGMEVLKEWPIWVSGGGPK
jgi:hypothetical protein